MNAHPVTVTWVDAADGGRKSLPGGNRYSTVSKFSEDGESWPDGAWSVVVEFDRSPAEQGSPSIGLACFLVQGAPHERLRPGAEFTLHEGFRHVATVRVTG